MMRIRNSYLILGLLTVAYMLSFMDRYVVNLLLNDIKYDLQLSEMQSGLIAGAGFAILYALMSIPMGIIADTWSRTKLVAAGVALWSLFTSLCGFSRSFVHLLLCRVGVGIGEASLTPSAYPLIQSLFKPSRLSTAIGVYSAGIYIGSGMAYWLGGRLLDYIRMNQVADVMTWVKFDWQIVFLIFGIPGVLLALLMLLVKAPDSDLTKNQSFDISAFKAFLKSNDNRFLKLSFASALFNVAVYAAGVWLPTYLQRVHHLSITESGSVLGIAMIGIAPMGAVVGGILADKLSQREGVMGRVKVIFISISAILLSFLLLSANLSDSIYLLPMILLSLLLSMPVAVTAAMVQEITPDQMKSTAPAFMLLFQNLIGMSLGPSLVAVFTQFIFQEEMSVGYSISIVGSIFCLLSLIVFYQTQKTWK